MKVSLTFDIEKDIPHLLDTQVGLEHGLREILNILDKFNIKGTFFFTGDVVKEKPKLIQLINDKKHEIGCHGLNHERLNHLDFKQCLTEIKQNKFLIEDICNGLEILGFRAPYLNPPKFIFKILNKLGFQYDSSIISYKELNYYDFNKYEILEFHPLNVSYSLRLPFGFSRLWKKIFNLDKSVLFFHPWEAINIREIMKNQLTKTKLINNYLFRPDRWIKTGDSFLQLFEKFLQKALLNEVKFIKLKDLILKE